jgi:carbamoyl-phosphate synthase large subunit
MDRGRTVKEPRLIELGQQVVECLPFRGALNIQCRFVGGRPTVFEINPRFAGGIPLTIAAGANFPRMLVDLALGRRVRPAIGAFTDRLWMTSYESSIFVESEWKPVERRSPDAGSSLGRTIVHDGGFVVGDVA